MHNDLEALGNARAAAVRDALMTSQAGPGIAARRLRLFLIRPKSIRETESTLPWRSASRPTEAAGTPLSAVAFTPRLPEIDQAPAALIPEPEPYQPQTLPQRQPADILQLRIVAQYFR